MLQRALIGLAILPHFAGAQQSSGFTELRLPGAAIATQITACFSGAKMHLNANECTLDLGLPHQRYIFSIPDREVSLGYLGTVRYQVRDVDLKGLTVRAEGGDFVFDLSFASHGAALKGSHSLLGDAAVPDVSLQNMQLVMRLKPVVTRSGDISYEEPQVQFTADVDNTFIPRFTVFGYTVDVVDALTGYRDEICSRIARRVRLALDDPGRKFALGVQLRSALFAAVNRLDSPIAGLQFVGSDLIVRLRR